MSLRVPKNYIQEILTNEIGRHVPRSNKQKEARQIKVDALGAIQEAGER